MKNVGAGTFVFASKKTFNFSVPYKSLRFFRSTKIIFFKFEVFRLREKKLFLGMIESGKYNLLNEENNEQ